MPLNKYSLDLSSLYNEVANYYHSANRQLSIFENKTINDGFFIRYLLERRYVLEYRVCKERGLDIAYHSLAIGPEYFTPAQFWDFDNSQRFSLEASLDGLKRNLLLMDEFLFFKK